MGLLQSNATAMNGVASLLGAAASFIPYTKNVTNVSATGVSAEIHVTKTITGGVGGNPCVITKFADDRAPIQIEDVTRREVETSTSGNLVTWGVVPRVKVVLSVIPCTLDDNNLGAIASNALELDLVIKQVRQSSPASATFNAFGIGSAEACNYGIYFKGGTVLSGPPSMESGQPQGSAESGGRWSGHSYAFLFTKWDMLEQPTAAPGFLSSLGQTVGIQ